MAAHAVKHGNQKIWWKGYLNIAWHLADFNSSKNQQITARAAFSGK